MRIPIFCIDVHAYAVMLPIIMIQWKMAGHLKRYLVNIAELIHVFSLNRDYGRNGTTPTGGLVFLGSAQIFLAFLEPKQIQKAKPRNRSKSRLQNHHRFLVINEFHFL